MISWPTITFKRFILPAAALCILHSVSSAASKELLHLDFDDKAHVTLQPAPLPLGTLVYDAGPAKDFPGSLSLGDSGFIRIPGFKNPQGPFSIEARFRLNQYAPLNTRYISDILNTATWDLPSPQINQGTAMRIGGGYLYSPLPENAYATPADYNADIGWYDDSERASVSKCIGEFVIANKDQTHPWMEAVTDRCISRNTWVHMVGVYDGANLHLYLNGQYATDTLRLNGKGGTPFLAPEVTAYVGARADEIFDSRHFDGVMDFVRVVDSAMGVSEIRARYRQTLVGETTDTLCHGTIIPEYPAPGQAVTSETQFRCRIVADGACTQPGFKPALLPTDSIEVEVASDFEFVNVLVRMVVKDQVFKIDPLKVLTFTDYKGAAYWRARVVHSATISQGLIKQAAVTETDWSLSRPFMLDLKKATVGLGSRVKAMSRILVLPGAVLSVPAKGNLMPGLWSLDGMRSSVSWTRKEDRWTARMPQSRSARLLLLGWN